MIHLIKKYILLSFSSNNYKNFSTNAELLLAAYFYSWNKIIEINLKNQINNIKIGIKKLILHSLKPYYAS